MKVPLFTYKSKFSTAHFFRFELRLYFMNILIWSCFIWSNHRTLSTFFRGSRRGYDGTQEGIKLTWYIKSELTKKYIIITYYIVCVKNQCWLNLVCACKNVLQIYLSNSLEKSLVSMFPAAYGWFSHQHHASKDKPRKNNICFLTNITHCAVISPEFLTGCLEWR